MRLVLASQSPRRREILEAAGIPFTVRVSGVPEQRAPDEPPRDYVRRLAREKARAVTLLEDEVILSADTIVVAGDRVFEKPADAADAARMLEELSGREHKVVTGVCLRTAHTEVVEVAETSVRFSVLMPGEIAEYVASGEPMDKAGGYAIQGLASKFISSIDGEYFNVVGLPVALVYRMLRQISKRL